MHVIPKIIVLKNRQTRAKVCLDNKF
jgi:hypothetical protein